MSAGPYSIRQCIDVLWNKHGIDLSWRELGKKLNIDHVYLMRLYKGEKENPSDETLRKLGLTKYTRSYEFIEPEE